MTYPENILVEIGVSDPWDWGTEVGCGPFDARILKWQLGPDGKPIQMLLSFVEPKTFQGVDCTYFVGSPRFVGRQLEDIICGDAVHCGLTRISEERANSADPFDLSWWRGGIGLTCTMRLSRKKDGAGGGS